MKLIRNARIYRIELPGADLLAEHLAELTHHEIGAAEFSTTGFVPPREASANLVAQFEGGLAFAHRYDEKIVPASVVNAEAKKRIAKIETEQDIRLARVARQEVREAVFHDLCLKALTRSTHTVCFYSIKDRLLIVPTASKRIAEIVTTNLLKVVGAIKSETIHVSAAKGGLTTRLRSYLVDGNFEAFDKFEVGGTCKLISSDGRSISVKQEHMTDAAKGLSESIAMGAQVESIRLGYSAISFNLTADFILKSIQFSYDVEDNEEYENAEELWKHEAYLQLANLTEAINALCVLLDYKEPQE